MSREEQQSADAPSVGGDLGRPSAASEAASDDPVFAAEQAHLSETYGKLEKIGRDALAAMEAVAAQAAEEEKVPPQNRGSEGEASGFHLPWQKREKPPWGG